MIQTSRTRRILKWTGVGMSLLILAAWGMSLRYDAAIPLTSTYSWGFNAGVFFIAASPKPYAKVPRLRFHEDTFWRFGFISPYVVGNASNNFWLEVPYWLLFVGVSIPTLWIWWRDRRSQRVRPGCCTRCGYDLTGNTSGVCSECGDKACPPAVLADSEGGKVAQVQSTK